MGGRNMNENILELEFRAIHWHIHHWPFQGYVSVNSEGSATRFRSNAQTARRWQFDHTTGIEDDDFICKRCDRGKIMTDEHERDSCFLPQAFQEAGFVQLELESLLQELELELLELALVALESAPVGQRLA